MRRYAFTITILMILLVFSSTGCELLGLGGKEEGSISGVAQYTSVDEHEGIIITLDPLEEGRSLLLERMISGDESSSRDLQQQCTTDLKGRYLFEAVPDGEYTLYASSPDTRERAVSTAITVSEGRSVTAPLLQLTPTGSISGRVILDESESGNGGFLVSIDGTSYLAVTKDDGSFSIDDIPLGSEYTIVIWEGRQRIPWCCVTLSSGDVTELTCKHLCSMDFQDWSFTWLGSSESAPDSPGIYHAYHDTTDGNSYIYTAEGWQLFASAGSAGADGLSIIWKGSLAEAPTSPEVNWSYYDTDDDAAYIYDGSSWQIFFRFSDALSGVDYYKNGAGAGSTPDRIQGHVGDPVSISGNGYGLTKSGYRFIGWNSKADGSGIPYEEGDDYTLTPEILSLYAQWGLVTYSVTYHHDFGENSDDNPDSYTIPSADIPLADLTGVLFKGWYLDEEYTEPAAGISAGTTGDISFYGKSLLEQQIAPEKLADSACFGLDIGMSGDQMIIGASQESLGCGRAYIYHRDSEGVWDYETQLHPRDDVSGTYFGTSVVIDGTTAAVGQPYYPDFEEHSKRVFIYSKNTSGIWEQEQEILSPCTGTFGDSLALEGDTLLIGDTSAKDYQGLVYLYIRGDDGEWVKKAELSADEEISCSFSSFGGSTAIEGSVAVVGAFYECYDTEDSIRTGSVYVFKENESGDWVRIQRILPYDGRSYQSFGSSIALEGSLLVVGSSNDNEYGICAGSAYIYELDDSGSWEAVQKLGVAEAADGAVYGSSLAVSGTDILISAFGDAMNTGRAYLYSKESPGSWVKKQELHASDRAEDMYYGIAVDIEDDVVVIGAYGADAYKGKVYSIEL